VAATNQRRLIGWLGYLPSPCHEGRHSLSAFTRVALDLLHSEWSQPRRTGSLHSDSDYPRSGEVRELTEIAVRLAKDGRLRKGGHFRNGKCSVDSRLSDKNGAPACELTQSSYNRSVIVRSCNLSAAGDL